MYFVKERALIEKDIEFIITYTDNGLKNVKKYACQLLAISEKDLVFFALDHLSLWEFEKELHLRIESTVSIDTLEYKIEGVSTIVDGKEAEQIFLSSSYEIFN
ncbi:hypothetical protein HPT25_26690 [Bacillus sp. BRMEA1]|uniref:hypothetical protein n=1 Tax=Neobacillus endophyticus TaxID=2738405 RepID=UPI001562EC25|nr:hypothetical protein [Neobacillus endophyticus]NRD80917.1 hypothetical protein [Neobacillus endophyticus]